MQILLLPTTQPARATVFTEYSTYLGYPVADNGQTHYVESGGVKHIGTFMSSYFYIMNNGSPF
jgi:hypothetical protein